MFTKISRRSGLLYLSLLVALPAAPGTQAAKEPSGSGDFVAFVGTYTGQDSKGIYAYSKYEKIQKNATKWLVREI
jgi:hypothetical protein